MKTIRFKSTPDMFRKEYLGLKPNTVRKYDDDDRFAILDEYLNEKWSALSIEIVNTETGEVFTRVVTDVTIFDNLIYIISWRHKDGH